MSCHSCGGNCTSCGGCAGTLELTEGELHILRELGQFSFLPVARKTDDMTPIYREDTLYPQEQYSLIFQCLEKKSLIRLDYDTPLRGADMSAYNDFPLHGCVSLTQRGYAVLELLETQGIN